MSWSPAEFLYAAGLYLCDYCSVCVNQHYKLFWSAYKTSPDCLNYVQDRDCVFTCKSIFCWMSVNTLSIHSIVNSLAGTTWEAGYIHSQGCCSRGPSRLTEIPTWKAPASFSDLLGLKSVILAEACPLTQFSQWSHLCRNSWPTQGINVPSAHRHSPDAHTHCSCNSGSWFEGHHVSHPYCKLYHSYTWSQ